MMRYVPKILSVVLIITAVLSVTHTTLRAQKKMYDTIPYAFEHHQKRLALFAAEPFARGQTIFMGDSQVEFGDWKKYCNDSTVLNRGIAGDNTFGVLDRLESVIQRLPSKLIIEIGINDISQNIPDEVIVRNILAIAQKVRAGSQQTQVYVCSILPTNDAVKKEYPDAYNKNNRVVAVNQQLVQKAKKGGFVFVNVSEKVRTKNGKLDTKYAETDGLHLNPRGYERWIEALKKKSAL